MIVLAEGAARVQFCAQLRGDKHVNPRRLVRRVEPLKSLLSNVLYPALTDILSKCVLEGATGTKLHSTC